MNALLIYPRFKYESVATIDDPLGILYIASALREVGHQIKVKDLTFERSLDVLKSDVEWADIIGISATTQLFGIATNVLNYVKTINPSIKSIIGGPHVVANLNDALRSGFDIAVVGEGEETVKELVSVIEGGRDITSVAGIAYRQDGEIKLTEPRAFIQDLDQVTFPARELIDYSKYRRIGLIGMRGCPYRCLFCKPLADKLFGKKIRKRSAENVGQEIEESVSKYGNKIITFKDDTLTLNNRGWFKNLAERFRERKLKVRWQCNSRVDTVDYEKLRAMKESGCEQIFFGVESGSQKTLDFYKKDITVEQTIETFQMCRKLKIHPCASVMLGAPFETRDDLEKTYQLIKILNPFNWQVHVTTPNPRSNLWDYAVSQNIMNEITDYAGFEPTKNIYQLSLPLKLDYLTKDDIREFRDKINRHMKIRVLITCMFSLRMWKELLSSEGLRIIARNFIKRHFNPFRTRAQ